MTFKTFVAQEFTPKVKDKTGLELGAHIGIDRNTVLVRKVGMSTYRSRTDRQNEVWAGKPVNMASKLAAMGGLDELWASDRYYGEVTHELVRKSCGCDGEKAVLWKSEDVAGDDPPGNDPPGNGIDESVTSAPAVASAPVTSVSSLPAAGSGIATGTSSSNTALWLIAASAILFFTGTAVRRFAQAARPGQDQGSDTGVVGV